MTIPKANFSCYLENRSLIEIKGKDRGDFLQGLITQDIKRLENEPIIYSLMLSPQGKFQFDFFIIKINDLWLVDIDATRSEALLKRLQLFKLRSDVEITLNTNWFVSVSSEKANQNYLIDPRLPNLGYRHYSQDKIINHQPELYENLRLSLGVPDNDMVVDKSIPLEWGMDELNAISWNKGCYMGQELTARSRYVGQIRKRAFPIKFCTPGEYNVGDKLVAGDTDVGELFASNSVFGIALLKIAALESTIHIKNQPIEVHKPSWIILPD